MLELNSSFLWIFFLVWALYFALNRLFFKPIHKIIGEREAKIAADSGRQESLVAEIDSRTRSLEGQLEQARKEARRIREDSLRGGEEVRARAVAEARERAARILAERLAQLDGEVAAAERVLEARVTAFSEQIRKAYS